MSLQFYIPDNGTYTHDCAGSIINEWVVVSAAHCFGYGKPADKWIVLPGAHKHSLPKDLEEYDGPIHKIHSLYIPKKWDSTKFYHDIAILVMKKPFHFNDKIKPIKMMGFGEHSKIRGKYRVSQQVLANIPKLRKYKHPDYF